MYWEERKAREAYQMYEDVEASSRELTRIYAKASGEIAKEARRLFRRFGIRNGLSEREAEKLLTSGMDIKDIVRRLGADPKYAELYEQLNSQGFMPKLNRLAQIQNNVDVVASTVRAMSLPVYGSAFINAGIESYYKELWMMQCQSGAGYFFNPMTAERVVEIMNRKWSGESYSQRVWQNTETLAQEVKRELVKGMLTGASPFRMSKEIEDKFHAGASNSRRLMRTEANYVANQCTLEAYKESGVTEYIYVAILDLKTSAICRELDKKRFLVKNAEVGENYPPMHPWCRSTTIAWMPDYLLRRLKQSAIDPATGERIKVPADMTYAEWYEKYGSKQSILAYGRIAEAEGHAEQVTADLKEAVGQSGSVDAGLPFRVKGRGSLARKIHDKSIKKGLTMQEYSSQVTDVLRFTDVSSVDGLTDSFMQTKGALEAKGYRMIECTNTFPDMNAPYRGINTLVNTPDGYTFELQFHTPQSLEIKEINHEMYEIQRLERTPKVEKDRLDAVMAENARKVVAPKNVERIIDIG